MDISTGDHFLHAFNISEMENSIAVVSDSVSTTPSDTPLCSSLFFSIKSLSIDLPELSETAQMPTTSFSESESCNDPELYPHSPRSEFSAVELFYTPQGTGDCTPLEENAPLLLQPNSSANILPTNHSGTYPTFADTHNPSKRLELFQTTAHNLANMESPMTPSVTTLALECGESALESSRIIQQIPIQVSIVDDRLCPSRCAHTR